MHGSTYDVKDCTQDTLDNSFDMLLTSVSKPVDLDPGFKTQSTDFVDISTGRANTTRGATSTRLLY